MGCLAGLESTLRGNETPIRENLHRPRSFHHARTMVSQERSPCARAVADALQRRQRPLLRDDRRNAISRNRQRRRRSHADLAIVHFPGEGGSGLPADGRPFFARADRPDFGAAAVGGVWCRQGDWIIIAASLAETASLDLSSTTNYAGSLARPSRAGSRLNH